MPMVYIIILNWNGWRDTIECLESVFRLSYPNIRVVICDNASTDCSIEQIEAWARGELTGSARNQDLKFLTVPPVPKPISFKEASGVRESENLLDEPARLILIRTGGNLGFAGGNNVGLRYSLAQEDCDFVWLLNNDTVVDPNALSALVQRMQRRADAGICGSTVLYYYEPEFVQALGGSAFNRWTGRGREIGNGRKSNDLPNCDEVESSLSWVVGASMLVRRSFIEQIGLMSEAYFLYFEEIDWATRARGKYSLAYAPQSIVYHKVGATISGTLVKKPRDSSTSDYYSSRSRMLFTRKCFPVACLYSAIALLTKSFLRFSTGNRSSAGAILRGLRDSFGAGYGS